MEETGFISPEVSAQLTRLSSQVFTVTADLLDLMRENLPLERQELLGLILDEGGRIGIEATVDSNGARTLKLVAVDAKGTQHSAASLAFVGDPPKRR